jgi:hypothetical protein
MTQSNWLEQLLANIPPILEEQSEDDPDSRHFVFERDDLGAILGDIEWLASNDDLWRPSAEGLAWLNESAGLDFSDLQSRWKQVPEIIVAKHVSDKYQVNEPRGLFGYLDQIRLAYVVGADLAAIALCRSTTELLMRYHYAGHVPNSTVSKGKGSQHLTGPRGLIEEAEKKYVFLRDFKLGKKVDEANQILHQPMTASADEGVVSIAARRRNPYRGFVIQWMQDLKKMIARVP